MAKGARLRMLPGHSILDHYVNNLSSTMRLVNSVSLGKQAVLRSEKWLRLYRSSTVASRCCLDLLGGFLGCKLVFHWSHLAGL